MTPENIKNRRLFSLFLMGCLIVNFPIISLFNYPVFIWGIPVLYIFLFSAWGFLIIAMIFITLTHPKGERKVGDTQKPDQKRFKFPNTSAEGPQC